MNVGEILLISLAIVLIILLIWSGRGKSESFDVYNNHTLGAEDVYNTTLAAAGSLKKVDFKDARLISKYSWAEKDPDGLNVYDKYYEAVVDEKNSGDETPRKTGYVGPYDSKFDIQEFNPPANIGSYNLRDMYDPNPIYMVSKGEPITLAQGNF